MTEKDQKFPQDPILVKLLDAAQHVPGSQTIIKDAFGFEKTYPELLSDVLETRKQLRSRLPSSAFDDRGLLRDETTYVAACTRTGYEFVVAFFAIRALGGACVPLDAKTSLERIASCISKANATCILVDKGRIENVEQICDYVIKTEGNSLAMLPISCNSPPLSTLDIVIDNTLYLDPNGPGAVVFTSGTTGYSKGVVIRRLCLAQSPLEKLGSAVINYNESHWLGGTKILIDALVTGKMVFAPEAPASASDVLEHFKNHRITHFVFNPALLRGMKRLLLGNNELTEETRERFSVYFGSLSYFLCIGGLVEQPTVDFWTEVIGYPFQNRYGTTELAGLTTLGLSKLKGSVGKVAPGIEVKLSEGTHGELLIKSPDKFICYLGDAEATQAAFTDEGYYKTGDIVELQDDEIIFHGRARDDYITFGASQISGLKVEHCLMELPYIHEACVVAVPIDDAKQLCGAVVRLKGGISAEQITLARIRSDLQGTLDNPMLPTVLRLMEGDKELPRTGTGKPVRRQVIEDYFYEGYCGRNWFAVDNPPPGIECYGIPVRYTQTSNSGCTS
ncbi:adenylate-forming enzyme AfeA [Xylariales sp. AK1849]|nr:adenylate-forming enzyme AfeA [Xylariales sp. AK1849]